MKVAVIDLGTNTCNLLIAKIRSKGYEILHQSKQLVKLGDNKISTNEISDEATIRVLAAFKAHQKIIRENGVNNIRVIATSGVRSAVNKISFLEEISSKTGWKVEVISGEKEAELIFKGVRLAFDKFDAPSLILDIGGGSNELIVTDTTSMIWKESRLTGMGRVINRFALSDPIEKNEVDQLQRYFGKEHLAAIQKSKTRKVKTLIGCSGAFDTMADILDGVDPGEKQRITQNISLSQFQGVCGRLLNSTRKERLAIKGMDEVRVDLIVPAVILIDLLVKEIGIEKIIQTDFALREGALAEMIG